MISGQWFMRRFFKEVTEIAKNYPRNIHTNLKQICAAFLEKNVKKCEKVHDDNNDHYSHTHTVLLKG